MYATRSAEGMSARGGNCGLTANATIYSQDTTMFFFSHVDVLESKSIIDYLELGLSSLNKLFKNYLNVEIRPPLYYSNSHSLCLKHWKRLVDVIG
jgi:hypothetical protein